MYSSFAQKPENYYTKAAAPLKQGDVSLCNAALLC